MKPIPTWQETLGNSPTIVAAGAVGQAMQQEIDSLRTRVAELEKDAAPCVWKPEDDDNMPGTYASCCGELWTFTEGGPIENGMKFCHHCGNPIALKEQPCKT